MGSTAYIDKRAITDLERMVNEQANDEGLWFIAQTAPEAYLQQELRKLHAACERLWDRGDLISEAEIKDFFKD